MCLFYHRFWLESRLFPHFLAVVRIYTLGFKRIRYL
nr:MAG TPA: hypothetical protein [Caudoviricetes sp.]